MTETDAIIEKKFFKYEFGTTKEVFNALILVFLVYAVFSGIVPGAAFVFSPILIFTFFSFFFFRVIYKMLDRESYDERIDKILIATLWIWIPFNYILSASPIVFTILIFYLFLKSRNFFLGQSIKINPSLKILMNSNFGFIVSYYLFSIFMKDQRLFILNDKAILLSFALWLTYLAYQLSKSMRGDNIDLKNDYVSAQVGPIKSSIIILGILLGQLSIFIYLGKDLLYKKEIVLGLSTLFVFHYFIYHFYILKGRERDAKALAPTTLSYGVMSLFIVFVASILESYL